MPFLSEADQDQIKTIFSEQMEHRVRLRRAGDAQRQARGRRARCAGRARAGGRIRCPRRAATILVEPMLADSATEAPAPGAVRFLGLPAGYEFSTLIADIVDASTGQLALSEATQDELRALDQDLHLQVFVTPT